MADGSEMGYYLLIWFDSCKDHTGRQAALKAYMEKTDDSMATKVLV